MHLGFLSFYLRRVIFCYNIPVYYFAGIHFRDSEQCNAATPSNLTYRSRPIVCTRRADDRDLLCDTQRCRINILAECDYRDRRGFSLFRAQGSFSMIASISRNTLLGRSAVFHRIQGRAFLITYHPDTKKQHRGAARDLFPTLVIEDTKRGVLNEHEARTREHRAARS